MMSCERAYRMRFSRTDSSLKLLKAASLHILALAGSCVIIYNFRLYSLNEDGFPAEVLVAHMK